MCEDAEVRERRGGEGGGGGYYPLGKIDVGRAMGWVGSWVKREMKGVVETRSKRS